VKFEVIDLIIYNRKLVFLILIIALILIGGCTDDPNNTVVKIAYQGNIEEAPLLTAYEMDFFKKEGVDIELVKHDFDGIVAGIKNGEIQGATVDYRVFAAVDSGAEIKIVAGLHGGCTQIITKESSGIDTLRDLKDKSIGVTKPGNGSMVVTSDLLKAEKIDQSVKWIVEDEENLKKLLQRNEIDAISILEHPDPSKRALNSGEKILYSSSNKENKGKSYKHFYESFIGLDDKFIKNNRKIAFKTSIAWLKAAVWVDENQHEAYRTLIDKGYFKGDFDSILNKAEYFMWMPGVKYAKDNVYIYVSQQRSQNILRSDISDKEFMKKIYEPLIPELNGR